jgi:dGTPase
MKNESQEEKAGKKIQRGISVQAHKYFLKNTETLTAFKTSETLPSANYKTYSHCEKTSEKPLYTSERDLARFRDDDETRVDDKPNAQPDNVQFDKDYARIIHSHSFRRLQGKSQLIPAGENEFFRTRLTHSLEVADIAKRIARMINTEHQYFQKNNINLDLISCACLLHDIGHPPFGHSGEEVLNQLMGEFDGFEGNAQTLRLVTKLENRLGRDVEVMDAYQNPRGLNLTARTLASIIKYDEKLIPKTEKKGGKILYKVQKGYYESETEVIDFVKKHLEPESGEKLKTIECQIMDIADDIAYSAYDLEDTMEADIVLPFDLISLYDEDLKKIKDDINKGIEKKSIKLEKTISEKDVLETLIKVFETILEFEDKYDLGGKSNYVPPDIIAYVGRSYGEANLHAKNPLIRRQFLETLIQRNINAVTVSLNADKPFLSKININEDRLMVIECLKKFNFHKVIATKKIHMAQHRSKRILECIFEALFNDIEKGYLLSDEQIQYLNHSHRKDESEKRRFVCDIIANLSDHEAVRLFNKLNGDGNFFEYSF